MVGRKSSCARGISKLKFLFSNDRNSLSVPTGVQARGYVPDLYEHFAASDLAIVQAGCNTTIELTALKCPFIYFPLEGYFEQQVHVAGRLKRHQAGIKMQYSKTTPEGLAEMIVANIKREVDYAPMRTDGAKNAVEIINQFLRTSQEVPF